MLTVTTAGTIGKECGLTLELGARSKSRKDNRTAHEICEFQTLNIQLESIKMLY